jgi:hypothetical protein
VAIILFYIKHIPILLILDYYMHLTGEATDSKSRLHLEASHAPGIEYHMKVSEAYEMVFKLPT